MNTFKRYTEPEIKWLKQNYGRTNADECAEKLQRTRGSILRKVWHLGLKKNLGVIRDSRDNYVLIKDWNHPNARPSTGYVLEHRKVMSDHLGRPLTDEEVVHHINGNRADNRLSNLQLFASSGEHTKFHGKLGRIGQQLVAEGKAEV